MEGLKENLYREALDKWGADKQILKTGEECAELQHAIFRYLLSGDYSTAANAIAEEIADVEIMLEQLRIVFSDQPIDAIKHEKLVRLRDRLTGTSRNCGG